MAGHSHWSQIKHKKAANDAKRAQLFTKLSKIITHAAREGGSDPEFNPTLADAIKRAKSFNMTNDAIDRAIKKATGEGANGRMEEIIYEGYGPEGVAIMISTLTDNKNRTVADIRHTLSKNGGSLGTTGSAAYVFGDDPENPQFSVELPESKAQKLLDLADALDDLDDVQDVWMNLDVVS